MGPEGLRPLDEADRLERRRTFEVDAERYAARRPGYPAALFGRLATYGGLGAGARVLEVAPGTGQATTSMAELSWSVTAVELGADLARVARRTLARYDGVEVVTGAFEGWPLPAEPFDAVVCATAWHWLDPVTRLPKAVRALRPGGTVAVVWTHHVAGGSEDFFARAQDCYRRWDPGAPEDEVLPSEDDLAPSTDELLASPLVTDVESHRFPVELTYSRAAYLDLLRTYSPTIRLTEQARGALLDCVGRLVDDQGGQVTKRYLFELLLARRPSA